MSTGIQFILAGRDFLKEQFFGHRYAYAVHNRYDLGKHPHLHVIVALRNSSGKTLNPNIRDFTEWRTRFAEKARERGISIDRQKRVERAGPPPVKRWEWEMFRRMGATAPTNVVEKVISSFATSRPRRNLKRQEAARSEPAVNQPRYPNAGRHCEGPKCAQHGSRTEPRSVDRAEAREPSVGNSRARRT
ncbi:relaxase/mobilization nuclease domain-containing protein [Rhizobium beringeri]